MSYVEPQGIIYLCSGVPLDNTYQNCIYFASDTDRNTYFKTKVLDTYEKESYTRVTEGVLKVQAVKSHIQYCNYMFFKNRGAEKTYFAFINSVEYISENCSRIEFEIDEITTWLNSVDLGSCLIKRGMQREYQSSLVSVNKVPEPISSGEKVSGDYVDLITNKYGVVIASTIDSSGSTSLGTMYGGIYSGAHYSYYDLNDETDVTNINIILEGYSEHENSIINMFMFPKQFWSSSFKSASETATSAGFDVSFSCDGYYPKNPKLRNSAYSAIEIFGSDGNSKTYALEQFTRTSGGYPHPQFKITCSITANPVIFVYPLNYMGMSENVAEGVAFDVLPLCSWDSDTYRAWLAQNMGYQTIALNQAGYNAISTSVGALGGVFTHPISSVKTAVDAAANYTFTSQTIAENQRVASLQAPKYNGATGAYPMFALGTRGVFSRFVFPNNGEAEAIDRFFSTFGYAQETYGQVKPYLYCRPYWNYIQTGNITPTGTVPMTAITKIKEIFNRGVTFWKSAEYVGHYNLYDNSYVGD